MPWNILLHFNLHWYRISYFYLRRFLFITIHLWWASLSIFYKNWHADPSRESSKRMEQQNWRDQQVLHQRRLDFQSRTCKRLRLEQKCKCDRWFLNKTQNQKVSRYIQSAIKYWLQDSSNLLIQRERSFLGSNGCHLLSNPTQQSPQRFSIEDDPRS